MNKSEQEIVNEKDDKGLGKRSKQYLLTKGPLLNSNGDLNEAGYAYKLVKSYDRAAIKAKFLRIKEWDYYYFGNKEYGIALTVADNSYMSLISATVLNFKKHVKETTKTVMGFMPNGKLKLPSSSENGNIIYEKKNKFSMKFLNNKGKRHLLCEVKNFKGKDTFSCDIVLEETLKDSMVIATPFNKPKHFYYNQKINLLKASGYAKVGNIKYNFDKEESYGVLDWGRGVWTYKNTWYWSSMSGVYKGERIGFNLGYGFGNTENASENMFFYKDKAYKLNDVIFNIPKKEDGKDDFMKPWTFLSSNGDICLRFRPIIDRYSGTNVLIIKSIQHQVFGEFSGIFTINGQKVYFENMLGFAEKVYNCW